MAVDLADTGVEVHVVNPGIIDTELFRLPDNDEPIADMSMALPVEAIVQPVVDQLDSGTFEIYVPEWFAGGRRRQGRRPRRLPAGNDRVPPHPRGGELVGRGERYEVGSTREILFAGRT